MAKVLGVVVLLVLVIALGMYLVSRADKSNIVTGSAVNPPVDNAKDTGAEDSTMKTFVITASHLRFFLDGVESPDIIVKEGDRVRIVFKNEEGFHDWRLDEFDAATMKIAAQSTDIVEFVAGEKGTFEYYCSVGKHRANGMRGNFIVE